MPPWVIGAIVGVLVGWLIAALRSRATHQGGGWFHLQGMGCFRQLFLMAVLAAIGAVIGIIIGS